MPVLFTGARDGRIRKWNPQSWEKPRGDVGAHSSMVTQLHLIASEKILVSISTDNTMRLWGTESFELLAVFRLNRPVLFVRDYLNAIYTFFDTGLILGWTVLRDFAIGEFPNVHKSLVGHHGAVTDCCFVGSFMVSASTDATLRVWHVDSGDCLAVLRGHQSPVTACCVNLETKAAFSSGHDGTLFRWELGAALAAGSRQAVSAGPAAMLEPVLEKLRVTASLVASVVVQWLDPFLESSAERELVEGGGVDEDEIPEGLAEGSQEAEEEATAMFRAALRSTVSDSDLWKVYNCRSALHELHLVLSGTVVVLEKLPNTGTPDGLARALRTQMEELLFTLEQHHVANQQLCFDMAALFKRPKVRSLWERRVGSAVPHSLLRDMVTVVADFLWALLHPLATLVKQCDVNGSAKVDLCKTVAMVTHVWASMARELCLSEEQVDLLWADMAFMKLCQCALLEGDNLGFLGSLSSQYRSSVFAQCVAEPGERSCGCLLEQLMRLQRSLFPDLHECVSTSDFVQCVRSNGDSVQLSRTISQFASCASDCGFDVMGAVLGPLLSQASSLSEAALTAGPAAVLLSSAASILPKFSAKTPKPASVTVTRSAPAARVRIGHEFDNRSFGAVFYSIQMVDSKLQQLLSPAAVGKQPSSAAAVAPSPQLRGPAEKMVRRASRILKKTFAALDKRKSLAIEKVNLDEEERDGKRMSARDVSPAEFASSMIGEESGTAPRKPQPRASQRNSLSSRGAPSFSWNDLLGLIEDDDSVPRPVAAASVADFQPWSDAGAISSDANRRLSAVGDNVTSRDEDEEMGEEMQSFLGLEQSSWRVVIDDEEEEDNELANDYDELMKPAERPVPVPVKKPLPTAAVPSSAAGMAKPLPRSSSNPPKNKPAPPPSAAACLTLSVGSIEPVAPRPAARLARTSGATTPNSPQPSAKAAWKKSGVSSDLVGGGGAGSSVGSPVVVRKPPPRPPVSDAASGANSVVSSPAMPRTSSSDRPPKRPPPEAVPAAFNPALRNSGMPSRLSSGFSKPDEPRSPPPASRPPPPVNSPTASSNRPLPRPGISSQAGLPK